MSGQAVYAANHKQWSDSLVLTEDGRFWRTAGFRGWSETSKSAGRWESAGNELTLTWFEWGPEQEREPQTAASAALVSIGRRVYSSRTL